MTILIKLLALYTLIIIGACTYITVEKQHKREGDLTIALLMLIPLLIFSLLSLFN